VRNPEKPSKKKAGGKNRGVPFGQMRKRKLELKKPAHKKVHECHRKQGVGASRGGRSCRKRRKSSC